MGKGMDKGFGKKLTLGALSVLGALSSATAASELFEEWHGLATSGNTLAGWAFGRGERYGQICDPYRQPESTTWPVTDLNDGCVVVWLSDRGDNFTVGDLPRDEQNNFQNTQHYKYAWNYNGTRGFKADSLPLAPQDLNPTCYIANISGTVTLGYEEPNGDVFLPCPGATAGMPYTEDQINAASDEELLEMCDACYQSVCTGARANNPKHCGSTRSGGRNLDNDDDVSLVAQASSAYHCHLTMANDGACDFVQYNQHEDENDRNYSMASGVFCGWQNVKQLNLMYCDCTREAGTNNGCEHQECLSMALNGVVCGNCRSCNQERMYAQIFSPPKENSYNGVCALATTAATPEERYEYEMLCSQGLLCRGETANLDSSLCQYHCRKYPNDPRPGCGNITSTENVNRRLLSEGAELEETALESYSLAEEGNQLLKAVTSSRKLLGV